MQLASQLQIDAEDLWACLQARDQANTALADSQGRVLKLEVTVAEEQKKGQQVAELERELVRFR